MTIKSFKDHVRRILHEELPDADVRRVCVLDDGIHFDIRDGDGTNAPRTDVPTLRAALDAVWDYVVTKRPDGRTSAYVMHLDWWVDGEHDDVVGYDPYRLIVSIPWDEDD